ncbi:hypothetical protein [Modestobacter sp. VKM Ac-2985]|uniref:hypothetical protein n=1 Tax=Modestobacter sp. VKM Ac-2985 TaxID=3004139 RepID=UPI0022AB7808|nr:hypothetical protein [Modestobacter sp. VKM Ac-2985]MCZ2838274.1 hypothetical protein [Modestobacter sp. VKM Ac-2985]
MLLWPVVAVVGFVVLAALVVALAQSSTARYEFERNQVQGQQATAEATAPVAAPVAVGAAAVSGGAVAQPRVAEPANVVAPVPTPGMAAHPAGRQGGAQGTPPAWWLVEESGDGAREQVLAGPFADPIEADWLAMSAAPAGAGRAVYGVLRSDGRLVRRQLPAEREWLSDLGDQLDRLPEEWDGPLAEEDDLVSLGVEVAAALVEAGLQLHDCAGEGPAGGVCLTPEPGHPGVLVSWHQHDRMSRHQMRGADAHEAVQRTMNAAIAECLLQLGFDVQPFGSTGCSLVAVDPH